MKLCKNCKFRVGSNECAYDSLNFIDPVYGLPVSLNKISRNYDCQQLRNLDWACGKDAIFFEELENV
jgi:hypothetical protein